MALTIETPFMDLILPVPTEQLGPQWAVELNAAFEVVDAHDHTDGKGVKITPAGFNINMDLDFNEFRAFGLKSSKYEDQTLTLTGATNASSVYSKSGDLYWTNGSGVAVQITSGGAVVSVPGAVDTFQFDSINSSLAIAPSDAYVVIAVDTGAARTITLPLASAVNPGRFYLVKDATGQSETNNITINPDGSDTIDEAASDTVNSNFGCRMYTSDGVSNWSIL